MSRTDNRVTARPSPTPLPRQSYVQWLAQAEQHELDRMGVLRDGRCADCGDRSPPEDACPYCNSAEGERWHLECDALGLSLPERRARRQGRIEDERQGRLL